MLAGLDTRSKGQNCTIQAKTRYPTWSPLLDRVAESECDDLSGQMRATTFKVDILSRWSPPLRKMLGIEPRWQNATGIESSRCYVGLRSGHLNTFQNGKKIKCPRCEPNTHCIRFKPALSVEAEDHDSVSDSVSYSDSSS